MKRKIRWDRVLLLSLIVVCCFGSMFILYEHRMKESYRNAALSYCEVINVDKTKCNFLK